MKDTDSSTGVRRQLAAAALAVVLVGGYYAIAAWKRPPTQPTPEVGQAVSEAFLTLIREGRAGDAWDGATAEFKSIEGRESFMRKVTATPLLREKLRFSSMQKVAVQETPRLEFLYQSPTNGKAVRVLVGYEGGNWKADRLAF